MASSKLTMVVVIIAIASFRMPSAVAQTRHVVGDAIGWTIPISGNVNYTTWASNKTFTAGDTLVFNFADGAHDVAEVTEAAYGPCTLTDPISSNATSPVTLTLTTGNHYYICTFRNGSHCQAGQKFTINVAASNGTTTPPTGSTTPTSPPPPSSASSLATVVPVTFLAAALALLY